MADPVSPARLLLTVRRETDRIAECAGASGDDLAVPSCPGWDLAQLTLHLGVVQRWVETMVRTGARAPVDRATLGPHPDRRDRPDWLRSGARRLVETLEAAGPDRAVWTFARDDGRSALWVRRMAYEAQVHRADAELAVGLRPEFLPDLAADGADEFLHVMLPRRFQRGPVPGPVGVLGLRCTDLDRAWTVRLDERTAMVEPGCAADAGCTVLGPAADVFLFVWNRPPGPGLRVAGDPAIARGWREEVRL